MSNPDQARLFQIFRTKINSPDKVHIRKNPGKLFYSFSLSNNYLIFVYPLMLVNKKMIKVY